MSNVNISDIADIEVGPSKNDRSYFEQLFASIVNGTVTYSFDELTIPKTTARRIYMRAYPKAKV